MVRLNPADSEMVSDGPVIANPGLRQKFSLLQRVFATRTT
jgi:hypothetical protein